MHLVEPLDFFFHGAELDQAWRDLLNDGGIAAEIVVAAQIEELGERRVRGIQVVQALLAQLLRGRGIGSEDQVGLKGLHAGHHGGADLAGPADDGDPPVGYVRGEPVGLLFAHVREGRTDKHGENKDAGADAELRFEFHAVL